MDIHSLLVITHVVGTAIGVGGATFAEIFIIKALKDGVVDPVESSFLRPTYIAMRVGLFILVISGFSFFLLARMNGAEEVLYDEKVWAKIVIVLIILLNAVLLQVRKVPLWLGSAVSLTSWYGALIIGAWHDIPFSFFEILAGYVVAIFIVAVILHFIRNIYMRI